MAEREQNFLHSILASLIGGDAAGAYGGFGSPTAPGGTPTFSGAPVEMAQPSNPLAQYQQMLGPLSEFLQANFSREMGMAEEASRNPFLALPNRGFFGRHPRLGHMLEGAALGASMTPGSRTAGEGIANVARTFLGLPEARADIKRQQLMRPLAAAKPLMDLYGMQVKLEEGQVDRDYKRALAAESRARVENMQQVEYGAPFASGGKLWMRDERSGKIQPVQGPDGTQLADPKQGTNRAFLIASLGGKTLSERIVLARKVATEIEADDPETATWLRDYADRTEVTEGGLAAKRSGGSVGGQIAAGGRLPEAQERAISDLRSSLQSQIAGIDKELTALERQQTVYRAELPQMRQRKGMTDPSGQIAAKRAQRQQLGKAHSNLSTLIQQVPDITLDEVLEYSRTNTLPARAAGRGRAAVPEAAPSTKPRTWADWKKSKIR